MRIRKRPRGKPSPQLYAYKKEKLQELEELDSKEELNYAEILWRILKGKWIRPIDYETTDTLFYCTNRALASVGTNLFVNYSYL